MPREMLVRVDWPFLVAWWNESIPKRKSSRLRLYSPKERRGEISRLGDPHKRNDDGKLVRYEVFGSDLFKKETNMKVFIE